MTHRERLQRATNQLTEVYEEVGYLRDHSTTEMQHEYNRFREYLPALRGILVKIDNKLIPDSLANKEL